MTVLEVSHWVDTLLTVFIFSFLRLLLLLLLLQLLLDLCSGWRWTQQKTSVRLIAIDTINNGHPPPGNALTTTIGTTAPTTTTTVTIAVTIQLNATNVELHRSIGLIFYFLCFFFLLLIAKTAGRGGGVRPIRMAYGNAYRPG